jgi:hypothetical protein
MGPLRSELRVALDAAYVRRAEAEPALKALHESIGVLLGVLALRRIPSEREGHENAPPDSELLQELG